MKLGPEHIGKMVFHKDWTDRTPGKLIDICEDNACIYRKHIYEVHPPYMDGWIILEKPKKPSERIIEIYNEKTNYSTGSTSNYNFTTDYFNAMIQYIDEEWMKK